MLFADPKTFGVGAALLSSIVSGIGSQNLIEDEDFTTSQAPPQIPPQAPVSPLPYQGPPLAYPCIAPRVTCINSYSAVMADGFGRSGIFSSYLRSTPGQNTGLASAFNASFLVFDSARGAQILGNNPTIECMFSLPFVIHEAPVYIPEYDK
jgi:hypothetical protein